ncbi:unnamed protein product, partial [Staurois parvus]
LVPCDLCDHSQIPHVVSNDVRSDILLTTLHVITDWSIGDHMIGTSDTAGTGSWCCELPGTAHKQGGHL